MSEKTEPKNRFVLGFLSGILSGALIGILYAPKSGRKLRRDIGRKKDELIDNTEEYIGKAKDKTTEIITDGKKKAEQLISDAKRKVETFAKNRFQS